MAAMGLMALAVAALLGVAMGMKYLTTPAFMPYHAAVVGKTWAEIDPLMQAIVLGMLRVVAGGFLALGVAIGWLTLALAQGAAWAPWAILTTAAAGLGPALYVSLKLRSVRPEAKTPVVPTVAAIVLIVVGTALARFG
ncbi:hypothetical protein DFR50_101127 [Roseiarcus fermentans]|uniref:DoxX-like protein n=1 Tax=Roseiarcus fermentans TaxID=1473586 RepID=A0A366FU26_9HYPH|nr:hypothetical protein [Roseiarcus fermentans]RBP18183.1 hypothetical protein DFR50_101127 [Roseiarcus fermentans]